MWLKEVKRFGLLQFLRINGKVTLQDLGRRGWQHLGITESGAADEVAYLWANRLLGNRPHCAALEITLGQCTLAFTASTTVTITGAPTPLWLNGKPIPLWHTFNVKAGDVLRLGLPHQGLLNYVAVAGGFLAKPVCGSLSICERESLGPNQGRPFERGECVGFQLPPQYLIAQRFLSPANLPAQYLPHAYKNGLELDVILTADIALQRQTEQLLETVYTVSTLSNRMAYRLIGNPLTAVQQTARPSTGTALGMVQLPSNGEPIVLLKDRQTMGGYPVLGCLTYLSCSVLAQCRPGQPITFKAIELATAQQATLAFYRGLGFLEP